MAYRLKRLIVAEGAGATHMANYVRHLRGYSGFALNDISGSTEEGNLMAHVSFTGSNETDAVLKQVNGTNSQSLVIGMSHRDDKDYELPFGSQNLGFGQPSVNGCRATIIYEPTDDPKTHGRLHGFSSDIQGSNAQTTGQYSSGVFWIDRFDDGFCTLSMSNAASSGQRLQATSNRSGHAHPLGQYSVCTGTNGTNDLARIDKLIMLDAQGEPVKVSDLVNIRIDARYGTNSLYGYGSVLRIGGQLYGQLSGSFWAPIEGYEDVTI